MSALFKSTLARLTAIFSLALLLLGGCAQVPTLDDGVMKASQLYKQGDYAGVIALLQPMADRDPSLSTTSLDLLGMAYFNKHQYPQAAAIMERSTAPGLFSGMPFGGRRINMRNHGVLGWCYFHMHDPARAMATFDKALAKSDFRREPAWDESALRGRGWARYFQGDFQGAAEDISRAQRIVQANPGLITDTINFDQSVAQAYINLAQNLDEAALAAAKSATIAPGALDRDVAPIYLMLGKSDEAYRLWGGTAYLGAGLQDYRSGNIVGARIEEMTGGSPAQQAGLSQGDIIVALDGQPVHTAQELARQISTSQPGKNVQFDLLRNGSPIKVTAALTGPDALIAQHKLLQPVLKVRPLPAGTSTNALASTSVGEPVIPPPPTPSGSVVPVVIPPAPVEASVPQAEPPLPPELRIEAMGAEPANVAAGERFEVKINLFALDQDLRAETVPVVLRYTISKDGQELARFEPETFQVPNGVPSSIAKKIRTSETQAKGEYRIDLEVVMGTQTSKGETRFNLR
jgi:tetratricopeptide (TPR) repeat protein